MPLGGYMGKWLFVDLSNGEFHEETFPDVVLERYLGGYGLGAYVLYTRQKPKVDPLGPEAMLGFLTGPFTGTDVVTGNRWQVVGKSPKTGTWGDANCGGKFGPALKQAGYDGIFFLGVSAKPVYLLIDNNRIELLSAEDY